MSSVLGVQAAGVHEPHPGALRMARPPGLSNQPVIEPAPSQAGPGGYSGSDYSGLPAVLVAVGCLVFALTLAAMAYLCVIKRR